MCPVCRTVIPAGRFLQHKKAHDNAAKPHRSQADWRAREKAIRRDRKCAVCGGVTRLEVHHKDGNPHNNEMWNLQTVCRPHHPNMGGYRRYDGL